MATRRSPLYLVYDAAALDAPLYRIVKRCPPVLEDFVSYEALDRPYDRRDYFRGLGISVYLTRARALAVARRFGHGRGIAALELASTSAVWARTGSRGHHTVWAPAETLLEMVVQCDEHE